MSPLVILMSALTFSAAASLLVLFVLSRPLVNVLIHICQNEESAAFWLSYTRLMLLIAPMLLVSTVEFFTRFSDPMLCLRVALMATLGGLLVGLHIIGRQIGRFVKDPSQQGSTL